VDVVGSASSGESWSRLPYLALLLTLVVAAALLLHVFVSVLAAWITVRRAERIEDPVLRSELASACERLGATREVDLRESTSVTVPVVWGLFRPVLLLPVEARDWTREQLRIVFLHEVAHVVRHDGIGLLLARVATSLFWFHPLVWKLARVARRECERCCDDLVLASGERATDYAAHLLAIVRSMAARPDPFAGTAPALAQISSFEGRLAAILRTGQRRGSVSRPRLAVTIASAFVLLVGTSVIQVVAAAAPADRAAGTAAEGAQDWSDGSVEAVKAIVEPGETPPLADATEGEHWFRAGHEAFQGGTYVRSASSFLAAAAVGYRRPESLYHAAHALAKAGAIDDALKTLEAAVEAGFDRTDLLAGNGDLEALRADPRFLALLSPKPAPEVMEVPAVPPPPYVNVGSSRRPNPDELNQSGIELMKGGQYDRAITAFEQEIKLSGSSNAMYNMACAYSLRGDKRRAFEALERAIENGFDNAQHMTQDEDLKLLQGDPRFYRLVRLSKELQLFGGGRFGFNDKDDWRNSLSRFERVAQEHPKLGRAWTNLGFARLQAGDPKGAADAYGRALDLGYQPPTMLYNLACCAARLGDRDEAFKWLDRADKAGFEVGEHVASDSDLDALRGDPRLSALLDRWDERMAKQHREKEKSY
jgi:beta-lactamase regulating signal transducer with metallopeptidase domain/Flp pilus assembly protein TadD